MESTRVGTKLTLAEPARSTRHELVARLTGSRVPDSGVASPKTCCCLIWMVGPVRIPDLEGHVVEVGRGGPVGAVESVREPEFPDPQGDLGPLAVRDHHPGHVMDFSLVGTPGIGESEARALPRGRPRDRRDRNWSWIAPTRRGRCPKDAGHAEMFVNVGVEGELGAVAAGRPGQGRRDDPVDDVEAGVLHQAAAVVDDPAAGSVAPGDAGRAPGSGNHHAVIDEVGLVGLVDRLAGMNRRQVVAQVGEISHDAGRNDRDPVEPDCRARNRRR